MQYNFPDIGVIRIMRLNWVFGQSQVIDVNVCFTLISRKKPETINNQRSYHILYLMRKMRPELIKENRISLVVKKEHSRLGMECLMEKQLNLTLLFDLFTKKCFDKVCLLILG